jgi:nucleotide-binding universal stress UspA family protein
MMDHILLPLDGSPLAECVLPHAVALARAFSAEITLLHVLTRPTGSEQAPMDTLSWHLRKTEAQSYLDGIAESLDALGLPVRTVVREGSASNRIVELANGGSTDLIMLSTHGRSALGRWSISGVVQEIMLRVNISTAIVRAHQSCPDDLGGLTYKRLLIPLDGSPRAEATLQVAAALARAQGSQLLLAHVVERPDVAQPLRFGPEEREMADRLVAHNTREAQRYLEEVQSWLSTPAEIKLQEAHQVARTLHEMVTDSGVDLVLLSAHGHSGQARWRYGGIALTFIVYGTTPLMIMQDIPETAQAEMETASSVAQPSGH